MLARLRWWFGAWRMYDAPPEVLLTSVPNWRERLRHYCYWLHRDEVRPDVEWLYVLDFGTIPFTDKPDPAKITLAMDGLTPTKKGQATP